MGDVFDTELMSEEEAEGLKFVPPLDEPEPTSEPKVEIKEPSPPGEPIEPAPKVEPEPILEPVKPPSIDGIIAKDGKNFIPFTVLEEERTKRQAVEAELAELKKPKEPAREPTPIRAEPKVELPDFKALGKKLYESEDGAAEVLQSVWDLAQKAATATATATASSVATTTAVGAEFEKRVLVMKKENPWIQGSVENFLVMKAADLMAERKLAPNDLEGMLQAATDAVNEGKKIFRVNEPKVDVEKARKEGYDAGVKALMAKLNIKEEPVTLANLRNVNPDVLSRFDEMEKLSGIDFEEAYGQLTPEEKDAFLQRIP